MIRRRSTVSILAAGLILCVLPTLPAQAAGWKMLPEDVVLALHFDMRSLSTSALYRSLTEQYGAGIPDLGPKYLEFIEATGFDVERDLESVTIGAGMPDGMTEGAFYMVVHGKFDREKIEAYLQQSGKARRGTHGALTTYVPQEIAYEGAEPMISWTDDETLIVASTPDFSKLVQSVEGSGLSAKSSALGRLLTRAHGQFYLAMEIPESTAGESGTSNGSVKGLGAILTQLQSPAAGPMQELETILFTLDATTGLDLALSASTDSAENGKQVYELLNSYLTIGRSMAAQDPQTAGILEQLELAHDGSAVEFRLSMSGDDVRAALQQSQAISED